MQPLIQALSRRIRDIRRTADSPARGAERSGDCLPAATGARSSHSKRPACRGSRTRASAGDRLRASARAAPRSDDADGPHLVAVSDRHRSWEMRVSAADVPRLQAVLDRVDGRLGDAPAPRGLSLVFSRCLVAVLSLLAFSIGQLTVAVVVLLASLRPARPLIGGAAAAAFAAALLVVRDGRLAGGLAAVVLGVAGAVLLTLASSIGTGDAKRPAPCRRARPARRAAARLDRARGPRPNPAAPIRASDPGAAGAARVDRVSAGMDETARHQVRSRGTRAAGGLGRGPLVAGLPRRVREGSVSRRHSGHLPETVEGSRSIGFRFPNNGRVRSRPPAGSSRRSRTRRKKTTAR